MDLEKYAVQYKDEYSSNATDNQETNGRIGINTLREGCPHMADYKKSKMSTSISEDNEESTGSIPCFTCHSVKESFDHENGQHIDNSLFLLHKISVLYQNQDLSDIQISVGHKVFHAHRLILSSSSDVFRVMLTNSTWPESRKDKVILKEEPECLAVFEDFLKYMYTGNIHLTHYTVLPVLMLADKYNVCDLRAVCTEYMSEHLVSTVEHNHAVSWIQYAYTCGHDELAFKCYEFIKWNFHKVVNSVDYLLMDDDLLMKLLQCSDLVIPDEFTLFKGISRWLLHQKDNMLNNCRTVKDFYNLAHGYLSLIRFPMINPIHLSQLERDPLSEHFRDFFMDKMLAALNYHMGNKNGVNTDFTPVSQWCPRNYTNEMWSTSLTIENFVSLPPHDVRPLFFSTPISASQADENQCWEWNLDLFPKGIHFQKCIMIGLWRNLEVCGTVYNNVRLVLTTKQPDVRNVDVSILIRGVQDNIEYVKQVVEKRCTFDKEKQLFQFNNIIPFDDLNCADSSYLSGSDGNSFQVTIIIKPV